MDNVQIFFRCLNATPAFLLKHMKNEHCDIEFHGIDSAISAARVILNYLKHTGAAKTFQHFCVYMPLAMLRNI